MRESNPALNDDVRTTLARLIDERGEDYAGLSRLLGRNLAYVQQFIRRGTPKRLSEDDRRTLAGYFGVDESMLGGPLSVGRAAAMVAIPRLDVRASAGPGSFADGEDVIGRYNFDPNWLKRIGTTPADLSIIGVIGDSMLDTLADGDEVLVDQSDGAARLRDGLYVLRIDDAIMVKRVALSPDGTALSVISDNPAYPSWPDIDRTRLDVIGRVRWFGRALR